MTEKEFKELKVGDKVRIISTPVSETPMGISSMDKWSGKIMTIREIYIDNIRPCARMKEDETSNIFLRVVWFPEMIAEKVADTRKIETTYHMPTNNDYDELQEAASPLVELLRKKGHPHMTVLVTDRNIELVEALKGIPMPYED